MSTELPEDNHTTGESIQKEPANHATGKDGIKS